MGVCVPAGAHAEVTLAALEAARHVLVEIAVHHFDLWRWLSGGEVRELYAAAPATSDRSANSGAASLARCAKTCPSSARSKTAAA